MIIDMSLNASGVRDTARSLHICPNTVLRELKKKAPHSSGFSGSEVQPRTDSLPKSGFAG
jgi:transposase-like protein